MDKREICRSIGGRLRSERELLGYSQEEFAGQGMVGRMSQVGYESGARPPTAEYLAKVARLGADVQYIVTGVRSKNLHEIDTAQNSLLYVADDGEKFTFKASKDLDLLLLTKIVESVQSALKGVEEYEDVTSTMFAKIVSIIYQNKKVAGSQSAPSTETIRSILDLLTMSEVIK